MKAGTLLKFSNRKKHWSKGYWFEVRGSFLFCYKSKVSRKLTSRFVHVSSPLQPHVNRRPKLSLKLNKWCKLTCIKEEQYCFEVS